MTPGGGMETPSPKTTGITKVETFYQMLVSIRRHYGASIVRTPPSTLARGRNFLKLAELGGVEKIPKKLGGVSQSGGRI